MIVMMLTVVDNRVMVEKLCVSTNGERLYMFISKEGFGENCGKSLGSWFNKGPPSSVGTTVP